MAEITDPQAIAFCNQKVRILADLATRYYYTSKALVNEWNATGMGTKIPNTVDVVADGADEDGRGVITGGMVNGLKNHVLAMLTDLEANTNQKLNILLNIEVNGSP